MVQQDELKAVRERIDALDEQIQALITERARCALEVARVKGASASPEANFYRPEREAEVLRNVVARNQGPLPNEDLVRLFREIMSSCRALQRPMRIAYLGPEGTYTQAAALKHFGHAVSTAAHGAIDEVFRDVEAGGAHFGVVPIENSTEGVVTHTLDMFVNSPLQIVGEVELRIHHCLLSPQKNLADVRRVYAHQQALAQCREWLDENLGGIDRLPVGSNAEAARRAAAEEGAAAIASSQAAAIYGLNVLASNVEDEPDNTTRFLIVGRERAPRSGHDKTSLIVSAPNRPGALFGLLAPLHRHGISMTRIESRPSRRGMWEYVFFIDIEGHATDPNVAEALQALERDAAMMKLLGSYPRAVLERGTEKLEQRSANAKPVSKVGEE